MDKRFANVQALVNSLAHCNSGGLYPHVFLDYDSWQRLPWIWEEGLPSHLSAVCDAEKCMDALYRQAEEKFRRYTDPCSPDSFLLRFQAALSGHLSELREALGRCRTQETAPVVNRIGALLSPVPVFRDLERGNSELTTAHPLPELARYYQQIDYVQYDPSESEEGLMKLVAKVFTRHGYDLLSAIQRLEEDTTHQLSIFQNAFNARAALSISEHITAPVQVKLPILRELLERESN
ncbi:hypothetical protein I4200191B4_11990 [Pseudoflavonifractor gallinarum]|uniref:hypothetical protein n=1 Tax=Pseudoflavonifractor gallinarum TaxID=2779352 RepID=UPI0036F3F84D